MTVSAGRRQRVSVPGMVTIQAAKAAPPPRWALVQRELISAAEEAAVLMVDKYTERGGTFYFADCVDDYYERYNNWGLFYAMGAGEKVLDMALSGWNAITRYCDDSVFHRVKHNEYSYFEMRRWVPQLHNEYFNLATQSGAGSAEWHHIGEANLAFYGFGVADPTISENVRRARKFAGIHMGEDPDAPNYDSKRKLFRSPIQTSEGPCVDGTVDRAIWWLQGLGPDSRPQGPMTPMGRRATLYPVVKELEVGWHEDPVRRDKIVELFEKIVLRGDTPSSLAATGLVTNAYLYTGDEKYKRWVLDLVEAWMDRMRQNNGIMPDNVGPTGVIGEHRKGQWWGGMYGWSTKYSGNIFNSLTVGAECALLLTGDFGYLDLLRSQIELLLGRSKTLDNGQLVVPTRHGPDGWVNFAPMRVQEPVRLYHASMDPRDYDIVERLREGDVEMDWTDLTPDYHNSTDARYRIDDGERARFQYYDGQNGDWPEQVMGSEQRSVHRILEEMRVDSRDVDRIIADNKVPANPVATTGLIHTMLGAPQHVYNGGLLRSTVRYFDVEASRPGVPPDVAALVDELGPDRVSIQLVNLSRNEPRHLIVQAGAFGEHQFTEVTYEDGETEQAQPVNGKYFAVQMSPSTAVRVGVGMRRFVNKPSYAFPWHGDTIPVPFQE